MAADELTHEEQVAELVELGMTVVQAERHLAAKAGEDISDVRVDLAASTD